MFCGVWDGRSVSGVILWAPLEQEYPLCILKDLTEKIFMKLLSYFTRVECVVLAAMC